jgi:mannose-1-phosphate guanylyltransferase
VTIDTLLLAAGLGTRLRPLTDKTPKCLLPVFQKPILKYWLDQALEIENSNIYINVHHLSGEVANYIEDNYPNQERIKVLYEPKLLGTARTLLQLFEKSKKGILAIHVDNYSSINLRDFVKFAEIYNQDQCVIATFKTADFQNSGMVKVKPSGLIVEYHHKPECSDLNLANAGIFYLPISILHELHENSSPFRDISQDILPKLLGRAISYLIEGIHVDIGTDLETYLNIESRVAFLRQVN